MDYKHKKLKKKNNLDKKRTQKIELDNTKNTNNIIHKELNQDIVKEFKIFPGEIYQYKKDLLKDNNFYLSLVNKPKLIECENNINANFLNSKLCTVIYQNNVANYTNSSISEGNIYIPNINDFVLGTIISKNFEYYKINIGTYSCALLGTTDFNGATKKTKPNLKIGDIVFAKVINTNKYNSPILTCSSKDSKDWTSGECFFGSVSKGYLFCYNLRYNYILLYYSKGLLELLKASIDFEHNFGYNGFVWINAKSVTIILKLKEIILNWLDSAYNYVANNGYICMEKENKSNDGYISEFISLQINNAFKNEN